MEFETQLRTSHLKGAWDIHKVDLLTNERTYAKRQGSAGHFSGNKSAGGHHCPCPPQARYTDTCGSQF